MSNDPSTSNPKGKVRRIPTAENGTRPPRHPLGLAIAALLAALSALYIINPGAGLFELLPDNLPLVGNLDEAAATALLLSMLAYLGINIQPLRSLLEKLNQNK